MNWLKKKTFLIYALLALLVITGCENTASVEQPQQNDKPPINQDEEQSNFEGLPELMVEANKLFSKEEQVITASEVYQKVVLEKDPNYQIIDVRDATTFGRGNIEGSINLPYAQSGNLEQIAQLPRDKKLVVVCFSGHTASQTAALWSMLGYDAVPMLNGMGGWIDNPDLGAPIQADAFDLPVDTEDVATENFESPVMLVENATNLDDLLSKGTKAYFEKEYPAVKPAKVVFEEMIKQKNENIMIVDIRSNEHYKNGHLQGAINIPVNQLATEDGLRALDPNKVIILVDYNGHVASKAARFLNIAGFETYPIKDGMRVWTSDEKINGIKPISSEKIYNYPTTEINVDLDSPAGPASCS